MELRKKCLKVLAFVPAIVLGGAFIGCHAGAFSMFSKPEVPLPETPATEPHQPPNPLAAQPAPESEPVFFSGTKSINNKGITLGITPGPAGEQKATPPGVPAPPKP